MKTARIASLITAAAATIAILPASQGSAPAAAAAPVALHASGTWNVRDLSAAARTTFTADLRQVLPAARPVLALMDGSIAINSNVRPCAGFGDSCSFPAPAASSAAWQIHLGSDITDGTYPSQRFVVYHEIGHAVWSMLLRPSDQQAFIAAFRAGLHGAPCKGFRTGRPCAPLQELFADEFARWAGGFPHSMTTYETPSAVSAPTMAAIVDGALAAHQAA
jgi:hypothetical protein